MRTFISSLDYFFHKFTKKWTLICVCGVGFALSWIAMFASAGTSELQVHFFDVGQGDAIFLKFPDGRNMLIDGGPDDKVLERLGSAMPFWDRSIDIVVSTHGDLDHSAGLVQVMAHYKVDTIIWNGVEARTKVFQELKKAIAQEGARVIEGEFGMKITFSPSVFFEILSPTDGESGSGASLRAKCAEVASQNNCSLVIRLIYGEDTFLFTGDIERQIEYEMADRGLILNADVLKIPHHGSKTSSSELFLEKVNPKIAVISVGRENRYGHPHEAILQRLKKYDIKTRRTDEEGDVVLLSNGNSFSHATSN